MTCFTQETVAFALAAASYDLEDLGASCITCFIDGSYSSTCLFVVELDEYEEVPVVATRFDPAIEKMVERHDLPARITYRLPSAVRTTIEQALAAAGLWPQEQVMFIYAASGERAFVNSDIVWQRPTCFAQATFRPSHSRTFT